MKFLIFSVFGKILIWNPNPKFIFTSYQKTPLYTRTIKKSKKEIIENDARKTSSCQTAGLGSARESNLSKFNTTKKLSICQEPYISCVVVFRGGKGLPPSPPGVVYSTYRDVCQVLKFMCAICEKRCCRCPWWSRGSREARANQKWNEKIRV